MLLGWLLETWQSGRSPQSEADMTDCVERTKGVESRADVLHTRLVLAAFHEG